jgi:GNAT superfamily N-acetyltransferase
MSLHLCPLELSDFDTLISHPSIYGISEDLIGHPTPVCWTVVTEEEALSRTTFHFTKQRSRFLGDPSVRYMKVVDTSDNSIISVARWHFYPKGYDFEKNIHWETHNGYDATKSTPLNPTKVAPDGFNIPLHNYILTSRDSARKSWIPSNAPCWILMHMVTRPSQRGRGAAGMLIRWGMQQSEKDGVPAYLEAGTMGKPVYEKLGFVQVGGLLEIDLKEHGRDSITIICKMAYYPSTGKGEARKLQGESVVIIGD